MAIDLNFNWNIGIVTIICYCCLILGGIGMMIRIILEDGSYDMVKAFRLDDLLPTGKIAKFQRSSGWVTVGVDPIRTQTGSSYTGPERRQEKDRIAA